MYLREPSFYSCFHYFTLVLKKHSFSSRKINCMVSFGLKRLIIIVIITIDWLVSAILFSYNATTSHVISTI